jgi:hypothetical protein
MNGYDVVMYETLKQKCNSNKLPIEITGERIRIDRLPFDSVNDAYFCICGYEEGFSKGRYKKEGQK